MTTFQVIQGLLTAVIATIAVYIAWQQWKANERRLVLDRYERRLRVYQRVIEFINLALRDFKVEPHEVGKFRAEVAEADFLLGLRFQSIWQSLVLTPLDPSGRTSNIAT